MDNYFQQCPAMVSDSGRDYGDFESSTNRNEYIKYVNNIWRDDQYRLFLQTHGKKFMDEEWKYYSKKNSCVANNCVHNFPILSTPLDYANEMYKYNMNFNNKKYCRCKNYTSQRLNPPC